MIEGPEIRDQDGAAVLAVRAQPRASRDAIVGVHDGALKVALRAPPVEGAANAALTRMLAGALGVPRGSVTIARGETGRAKQVRFATLSAADLRARIQALLEAA